MANNIEVNSNREMTVRVEIKGHVVVHKIGFTQSCIVTTKTCEQHQVNLRLHYKPEQSVMKSKLGWLANSNSPQSLRYTTSPEHFVTR